MQIIDRENIKYDNKGLEALIFTSDGNKFYILRRYETGYK